MGRGQQVATIVHFWTIFFSAALAVVGGYLVVYLLQHVAQDQDFTRGMLAFYMLIFGIIAFLCELRVSFVLKRFAFLEAFLGKGLYYGFCGSMGLAFGWGSQPNQFVPFLTGILSLATSAFWVGLSCCASNTAAGYESLENGSSSKEPAGRGRSESNVSHNKQYAGPSAI
eukprot:PhF_6_TR41034/c0_g1_i1/m.62153